MTLNVPVNFGGVTFLPEITFYADNTGIILSQEPLETQLDSTDEDEDDEDDFDTIMDDDQ